jgi:hypothetical protein
MKSARDMEGSGMDRESRRMEEDDEGVVVMGRKEDRLG